MPQIAEPDFTAILQVLVENRVDFIVVGGISAVLNGVPINTFDLDVVHGRSPTNVRNLLSALDSLDAYYRLHADKKLKPGVSHLTSPGHSNLTTRFGPLDLLGTIGRDLVFEDLLKHSAKMKIKPGLQVWVLGLAKLIEVKEQLGGEKDKAVLPILKRTLREIAGRG